MVGSTTWVLLEIYLAFQQWKDFENPLRIDKVIAMSSVCIFLAHPVYDNLLFACDCVYCRSQDSVQLPNVVGVPLKWRCVSAALLLTLALYIHVQQLEFTARLDFIWKSQVCLRRLNRPITRLAWLASVYFLEYSMHCSGIQNSPIFRALHVVVINVVIVITTTGQVVDRRQSGH